MSLFVGYDPGEVHKFSVYDRECDQAVVRFSVDR